MNKNNYYNYGILIVLLFAFSDFLLASTDFHREEKNSLNNLEIKIDWEPVQSKKIVFFFRSVGRNIIDVIKEISERNNRKVNFIESSSLNLSSEFQDGFIVQKWIDIGSTPKEISNEYDNFINNFPTIEIDFALIRFSPYFS